MAEAKLMFVAVYKEISHMVFVDELLDMIAQNFIKNVLPKL